MGHAPGSVPVDEETINAAFAVAGGARTIRAVAAACGWPSPQTAHHYLRKARELGLVGFTDGRVGTLHPTIGVAAMGSPNRSWRQTSDYVHGYRDGLDGAPADPDNRSDQYQRGYLDGRADAEQIGDTK
jgi:hypothetical protein